MTFDLDIWRAGSSWHCLRSGFSSKVEVKGQSSQSPERMMLKWSVQPRVRAFYSITPCLKKRPTFGLL